MDKLSRRTLLMSVAGAGTFLGAGKQAFAFSESEPTVRQLRMHDNACGASASHKELVAEVERVLGDKYSDEEKKRVVANLTCPVCGCPLAGLF